MRKLRNQRGLSLVEVTIMLLVLMLLTSVLAPSIFDFVIDAKWVKVKEDCEAIGISTARLVRDVGPCIKHWGFQPCTMGNRVDIMKSDGPAVVAGDLLGTAASFGFTQGNGNQLIAAMNWEKGVHYSMEGQFTTNTPLYLVPSVKFPSSFPVGPLFGLGWRGGYLSSPIGPDPWGMPYLVNSEFLAVAIDAGNPAAEGYRNRWWDRDTFCISAGPNQKFETFYGGCNTVPETYGTCREGDDFIYIISGASR